MISLFDTINKIQYYNKVIEEYCNIKEIDIINESFRSSILNKLAKAISDVYASKRAKGKKPLQSFKSFFKPIKTRWGKFITGVKWSEITDNDFKKFDGDDKVLHKLIRATYSHKIKSIFIICDKITEDILYFVNGNIYDADFNAAKPKVYEFSSNPYNPLDEKTMPTQTYRSRTYNVNETISLVSGTDVYFLEFTTDMFQSYRTFTDERDKQKNGVINFDEDSLKEYRKKQQARYAVIVKEMKAKRLEADKEKLFDDLKKTNADIISLYEQYIHDTNFELIDKGWELSRMMDYISRAFEKYYNYIHSLKDSKKHVEAARKEGVPEKDIERYDFYKENAKEYINACEGYLKDAQDLLEKTKNALINDKNKS